MKSPWIAGILNFILPGVGYLYLGIRKPFAILLLAGGAVVFLSGLDPVIGECLTALSFTPLYVLGGILMASAFAVDAVLETKRLNSLKSKNDSKEK
ncbi:MAG TPA: hypothetical protein VLA77_03140 [Candidatus Saccharimonadales bacterium]|nr:hypothetical protein [Candidatus Saccharimonadales bacterium]